MLYSNIHTHLPAQRMIFGFGRAETKSNEISKRKTVHIL